MYVALCLFILERKDWAEINLSMQYQEDINDFTK